MTVEQTIYQLLADYGNKKLTLKQLTNALKFVAVTSPVVFNDLKRKYMAGAYDGYLPAELRSTNRGLGDADANALPALKEYKAIEAAFNAGQLTMDAAKNALLALGRKYPGAVAALVNFQGETNFYDFMNKGFDAASATMQAPFKAAGKVVEAGAEVATKVVDTAIETGKDIAGGIGSFFKTGSMILIGVVLLGGFAAYKIITGPTGQTLAKRV